VAAFAGPRDGWPGRLGDEQAGLAGRLSGAGWAAQKGFLLFYLNSKAFPFYFLYSN
jgi:hypothetical protein